MKNVLHVALAVLVCSATVPGAMAQWSDDFESYAPDLVLPTPPYVPYGGVMEDEVVELVVQSGIGYGNSQGITKVWDELSLESWRAWTTRPADPTGNDYPIVRLTGRVILQNPDDPGVIRSVSEFTIGAVGYMHVYNAARGNAWFAGEQGTDCMNVTLMKSGDNVNMTFSQHDWKWDSFGAQWTNLRITHSSADGYDLEVETWYDIKIKIEIEHLPLFVRVRCVALQRD